MAFVITGIIVVILNGLLVYVNNMMNSLYDIVFYADRTIQYFSPISFTGTLKDIFYNVGISLIMIKFLKKGFDTYVLWTDGDPDADPINLVINFIKAMVVAITFPYIYEYFVSAFSDVMNSVLGVIDTDFSAGSNAWITAVSSAGLVTAIFALIFLVFFMILYFSLMMRGIEMMILVVGMPIACVGLIDNDKGIFRSYVGQFIKSIATTILQITLCKFGLAIILNPTVAPVDGVMWGIAFMAMSISMPKIMREYLLPTGGGGGQISNTVYHTARIAGMAKSLIK